MKRLFLTIAGSALYLFAELTAGEEVIANRVYESNDAEYFTYVLVAGFGYYLYFRFLSNTFKKNNKSSKFRKAVMFENIFNRPKE